MKMKSPQTSNKPKTQAPDLSKLNAWLNWSKEAGRKTRWEWFVIDQFLKGNHNVRGNPQDNTIEMGSKQERVNFPINQMKLTFRSVKAFVTRHKPIISVEPEDSSDEAKNYARRANKLIERDNQKNGGQKLNREWAHYGVKYGVGWRQIGYDTVKKCAIRWTIDPFDLYIGAKSGKAEDAPYLIKAVTRTVGYWKEKYPKSNVSADGKLADDEYKELSMQIDFETGSSQEPDESTAIGYECWYRLFEKNSQGGLINKCLFTETEILSFEETPYEEYPFVPYEAEVAPNELYPDGHMKDMIAPQRMLNLLNTQLLEYNHIVNRGTILKPKNAGFKVISAREGRIIEYNPGKKPEILPPPPVSSLLERQINLSLQFIQDIGAQQDASRGRLPSSGMSGDAIEALQMGDANTISDLRDNFEDALAREASWILKVYSLFETDGVVLEDSSNPEDIQKFAAVGSKAYESIDKQVPEKYYIEDNGSYCATCAILPENNVSVSVNSELGETKASRIALLKELVTLGLPLKVLLEHLEFPNTDDIFQRMADEAMADMALENMKAQGQAQAQVDSQPVPMAPAPDGDVSGQLDQIISSF